MACYVFCKATMEKLKKGVQNYQKKKKKAKF